MNGLVIGGAALGVLLIVALLASRSRRGRERDLGSVSSQWITEYRASTPQDLSQWHRR